MDDAPRLPIRSDRLREAGWHTCALVLLIGATWLVYQPSLDFVPRWDHWSFLREVSRDEDFASLLRRCYSYNRSSVNARGDCELFRPVLFTLLCAEQALFGHDFAAWQRVGVLLHLAVVLLLLLLLLRLRLWLVPEASSSFCPLAYGFCLFFSLNVSLFEMVAWSHINGYMLFVGFCLAAVLVLWPEFTDRPAARLPWLRLLLAWTLLALAAFTHEVGQFFAVVFALVLGLAFWRAGRRGRAVFLFFCFALLLPIYQTANSIDLALHDLDTPPLTPGRLLSIAYQDAALTAYNVWRYVLFTLVHPFFPSCVKWSYFGRVVIGEPTQFPALYIQPGLLLLVSYAVVGLLLFTGLRSLPGLPRSRRGRVLFCLLLLPAALIVLQTTINVLGRLNLRPGSGILNSSCYYCYQPTACLLLILYALWQVNPARTTAPRRQIALLAGLLVLTGASALRTREISLTLKAMHRHVRIHTRAINGLVKQHRHDPTFRFSFDPAVYKQLEREWNVAFPEILFPRFIDHVNPTFVFVMRERKLAALPVEEYCRQAGCSRFHFFPAFRTRLEDAHDESP